ncbi:serine O-acetyltransferase [Epibacterium ulvae]|uniref:serine O-acetyltransferase n=1 Tax=Epibacterium ulvae TaxID=1156985 RepID=UPI0024928163|nr:serine O-acetyltransferase [Epibacterium ulvae]
MSLIEDTARLFHKEPALAALYGFTPGEVQSNTDLLAAVLAGLVPDAQARGHVRDLVSEAFAEDAGAVALALDDLAATAERDISTNAAHVLLFAPGYQGLLSYRASRALMMAGRETAATALKALLGRQLGMDIAPEAQIGRRVWLDHGLGVVIGRTAIIEDDVCIWHGVTLGSNFVSMGGRRHPLISKGAVLGGHSIVLGGIDIGENAVVAAGAIVTKSVPPGKTVYGPKASIRDRKPGSFRGFT